MPDGDQTTQGKTFGLPVKIIAGVVVSLIVGLLFEAGARVVYVYRDDVQGLPLVSKILQQTHFLDSYEMPSPRGPHHWILRSGYDETMGRVVADKKRMGRNLGAQAMQAGPSFSTGKAKGRLRINADGFKGPELDQSHARPRILSLGDSVTFGLGASGYPRRLEAILNEQGLPVEVINGGVEGYAPRNILYEIERYKSLKPEIVTLYIGWNALSSGDPWPDAWENRVRSVWLFKRAARTLKAYFGDSRAQAERMYSRDLKPDRDGPDVKGLSAYTPPFMEKIETIVEQFQSIGTEVVLVTLPGLFTLSEPPTPKALKIGHLPESTKNPYVLAKLTERYNAALRILAAKRGLAVIDLEKWSASVLQPREAYFSDSVHLTAQGLDLIGAYMATRLAKRLENLRKQ
ncbi:MAG: SGNH/GDSL hydrolase family protein [Rhodospirillales bacterium]|nr:SGNH/GDSL hydrolase family protein [Rhodospirillales bacterium]